MRMTERNYMGSVPILVVAPRMITLYAHAILSCYATTDYTNHRDFSFGVSRYVILRLMEDSKEIRLSSNGDTSVLEAGVCVPEIKTLDALFKEVRRLENKLGICAHCGKSIDWTDPIYADVMSQAVITLPGTNRRLLSAYCLDCLALKQIGGDVFCPSTA